jgi:Zn-dependent protease with chaperone function
MPGRVVSGPDPRVASQYTAALLGASVENPMNESVHPATAQQRFVPRNRESFFDAQRRNRQATWRLSCLCLLAVVVMGIPLALTVTPLLYAATLFVADVVNLFAPLPSAFWQQANEVARFGFAAVQSVLQHRPADPQALAIGAGVMLLPGAALSTVLGLGMTALFRRGGVGGALLALNAREPNQSDLKELQLADVVQEMAIAAGLPAPRVMLIDAPGANAAAIGTSPADARVVISRCLVDDLGRDELEGVLAHLVASVGNGDLRIAFRVTAVLEACGLLVAVINSPFGSQSRHTLWRIIRYGLGGSSKDDRAREAAAVADILARGVTMDTDDIDRMFDTTGKKSLFRSIRNFLLFPILFTNLAIKLSLWFFSATILGPSLALLWRTRKYLADASAVQLTRSPDGLASALQKLGANGGAIPGGSWASHLFIVRPGSGGGNGSEGPSRQQREILAQAWAASAHSENLAATQLSNPMDFAASVREFGAVQRAAFSGDVKAIARLQAAKQALSALDPALAAQVPEIADLAAARQGDRAAMARLRSLHRGRMEEQERSSGGDGSGGISSITFLAFHPPLKRRLKRLDRMGAHADLGVADRKMWIVAAILSLALAPFVVALAALFLVLIAIMILASLTFLVLWMAFIHAIFGFFAHH